MTALKPFNEIAPGAHILPRCIKYPLKYLAMSLGNRFLPNIYLGEVKRLEKLSSIFSFGLIHAMLTKLLCNVGFSRCLLEANKLAQLFGVLSFLGEANSYASDYTIQ